MKKHFRFFALGLAIMLFVTGTVLINLNKVTVAYAAEYSYTEGVDGISYDANDNLVVDFTVTEGTQGELYNWVVYFFTADSSANFAYDHETHKYQDSAGMDRSTADYYYVSNNNTYSGHVTITISPDAHMYSNKGISGDPVSTTDYLNYDTGKTLAEIAQDSNWYISAGPLWASGWSPTGIAYNVEVYVGRGDELIDYNSTVYFREFDGTMLDEKTYTNKNVTVDVSDVNFTPLSGKTFTGWYCDVTKTTYANLTEVSALNVSSILTNTKTVNFYATYQKNASGKYIEFTPVASYTGNYTQVNENDTIVINKDTYNQAITFDVVYKITHNDGVNSILLMPEYDASKFSITNIVIDEETVLGEATITNNGFDKIAMESDTKYSALNNSFMTITYQINTPADGDYSFGLKIAPYETNNVTQAFYILDGQNMGNQEELEVVVINTSNVVKVLTTKNATIEIGYTNEDYYLYTYTGSVIDIVKVNDLNTLDPVNIEYTYNGTATPVAKWYTKTNGDTYTEIDAPVVVGEYYVGVSAPAHGLYNAVSTVYREVIIEKVVVDIYVDDKQSVYGENIVALTYNNGTTIPDTYGLVLTTTATSSSNVGTYPITVSTTNANSNYDYYIHNGTYTITAIGITVTALPQQVQYSGAEPAVDQTAYTIVYTGTETTAEALNFTVTLTKEPSGYNVGSYSIVPLVVTDANYSAEDLANYNFTYVNGTFTITSASGTNVVQYFAGRTVTYNGEEQNLLTVNTGAMPQWLIGTYTAENNLQTNVLTTNEGWYVITITITLDQQTATNEGLETPTVFTVNGKILPYNLTITAGDKTSEYGATPVELTPTVAGLNDEIAVALTVLDNTTPIELSASTDAGEYTIVPSATNTNYNLTFVNGTYTVTKATPVVTVTAQNVKYYYTPSYSVTEIALNTLNLDVTNTALYTVTFENANEQTVSFAFDGVNDTIASVPSVGTYTVKVTVTGTDNYNTAVGTATFAVETVYLANPEFTYNHNVATWTAITTDRPVNNVSKQLVPGTTVAYAINTVVVDGCTYTATSTNALALRAYTTNNTNYLPAEVNLANVYSVEFTSITGSFGSATNMPETQYQFAGQTAVQPNTDPAMTGYTFGGWDFTFTTPITQNTQIPAIWNINQYTMTVVYIEKTNYTQTSKTFVVNYGTEVAVSTYNLKLNAGLTGDNDDMIAQYDLNGMRYAFNDLWSYKVTGESEYIATEVHQVPVTATTNLTFVAVYTSSPIPYSVTYMVSVDGGDYTELDNVGNEYIEFNYNSDINYKELSNLIWFHVDTWYTDANRTEVAPSLMPANNLTVYGAYVFDIGQGDINADGHVDANDIILYRQWIVGGYEMSVINANDVLLETANAETATATLTRYLLTRVADNNGDNSMDIRDVSVTRMSIVGGYSWDIVTGDIVTGASIVRNTLVSTLNALDNAITVGGRATVITDIEEANGVIEKIVSGNVLIDLNGKTITLTKFTLTSTGTDATVSVINGTIVTTEGITISAPNGNVVLTDLTGYDSNGLVNLAAASNSLHINGIVTFIKGTDTTVANPEPAVINIEKGTHLVIEEDAEIKIEKIVVTENFVETQDNEAVITINNYSAVETEIVVEGDKFVDQNTISTFEELVNAGVKGGTYTLEADILAGDNDVTYSKSVTLNLNNHNITFTDWGFEVRSNATLTFNGNGTVTAVEAPLYAQRAGNLVVNGGTYVSTENFVIGTHGSEGRGNNTITINGGTFNGSMAAGGVQAGYVACGIYVANDDVVTLNGGTFNVTNGVGVVARSGNTTIGANVVFNVTGNGTSGKVGDARIVIPSGNVLVLDLAANYPGGEPTITNNSNYNIAVVVENQTDIANVMDFANAIVLGNNITSTTDFVFTRDIVFNFNGNNITFTSWGLEINQGTLTMVGNGTMTAAEACLYAQRAGKLVVNGGTYVSTKNFVIGTNGSEGRGSNVITVNAGTFNASMAADGVQAGYVACGIYVANADEVTLNAGTLNVANGAGVIARSGNTTIGANFVINATGNGTAGKVGDSRVVIPSGNAIVLDLAANYPGGQPSITNNSNYQIYTVESTNN